MNLEKVWARFVTLLSLELHDGDVVLSLKRPCKNMHGSIESYKKIFDQAAREVTEDEPQDKPQVTPCIIFWEPKAKTPALCKACGHETAEGDELTQWGWDDNEQTQPKMIHRKCPRKFELGGEG